MPHRQSSGIYIPEYIKPFPKEHELFSARALVRHGYYVEFLQPDNRRGAKTADILLNNVPYELKSPLGGLNSIERNLKRASKQSINIVFDSRRMRTTDSKAIKIEFLRRLKRQKVIKNALFIDRHGRVIDTSGLY